MPDGREVWGSSSRDYVKNAITTIERLFEEDGEGFTFRNNVKNLFPTGYNPELDVTEELGPEIISRYIHIIGICRWAVELRRIDIFLEVYLLSQYKASSRLGHLEVLYNVFAYLKEHPDMGRLAYDSKAPDVDESAFVQGADWKDFYGDVNDERPPRMSEPRGNRVIISAFVDADNAGNIVTRRLHTGIIVWLRAAVRLDNFKYYEILFVYVDYILALSHKATEVITDINSFYKAKKGSIKPPDIYLGANIDKIQMPDGREVWGLYLRDYVKNAIITVERIFEEDG